MVISILGCGWYGKALARLLLTNGLIVKGSATTSEKAEQLSFLGIHPYVVRFNTGDESYDPDFFNCDVLVICIPPHTRQGEAGDYLPKIQRIVNPINKQQITKVIYISSTAVYGDSNSPVDERDSPAPDTEAGEILLAAEKLFRDQASFKTTIIRFAGLVGPDRHPGRFFAGKKEVPNGKAPVNLIHLDDCIAITKSIITQDAFGYVLNACSPDHPQKTIFYRQATLQAGLTAPEFIDELNGWKIINSALLHDLIKYRFKVPVWKDHIFD